MDACPMEKVLVVDDENTIRVNVCEILRMEGFSTSEASNGEEALAVYRSEMPDAVLLDLKMPGMNGIETLKRLKEMDPLASVIIVTAYGDVETAVQAIKLGAFDFILKPPDFNVLPIRLKKAIANRQLEGRIRELDEQLETSVESCLGNSPAIRKVIEQVRLVASSNLSVIMQGETGTGKTYIANIIHNLSNRAKGPFIAVDVGAIPETLMESELFGHEKGAFTGAERRKQGFFEIADRGTILIDEIQNIPPSVQGKLLSVVEQKKIHHLGSTEAIGADIRIIAATNRDIGLMVGEKKFREDLYFRLCEFVISIPPLRERHEDIVFLARKFSLECARYLKKQVPDLSEEAAGLLKDYAWPGNIRELKNVMKRAVLLCDGDVIAPRHVSFFSPGSVEEKNPAASLNQAGGLSLAEIEKMAIEQTLELTGGNKTKAASILEIDYTTLLRKIKQYCISP